MGRVFDATSSYATLLTILSAATAVSALLMLLLPGYPNPLKAEPHLKLSEAAQQDA
jgi:hypothetical protein